MQSNRQIEGANNSGELQQGNNSDDEQIVISRKMMQKEVEVMVIRTVHQVVRPVVEDLIRKVVKEEIHSAQEKFLNSQNQNSMDKTTNSRPRSLELKFLDKVSDSVLTGKEIKGKDRNHVRVALTDAITGLVVDSGLEASAKVEILIETDSNDNAQEWRRNECNNRIVRENDKTRPHFSTPKYIYLEKGIGTLFNVKLGHGSHWTKICRCRLGARIMDNLDGSRVKEAWTESFMVHDSRRELYEKHYPPSLSDHVWRLDNIGKDGARCKRLHEENISTVQEFLFLHSIDCQKLQRILDVYGKTWEVTVNHARQCIVNDEKIQLYPSSSELKMGVVFDVVGQCKGVIRNRCYVPIESATEIEKDEAQKLLRSAFDNRKDIFSFDNENFFLLEFPRISNDNNSINSSGLETPEGLIPGSTMENIDGCYPTGQGTSSQGITPSMNVSGHLNGFSHSGYPFSKDAEYSCQQNLGYPGTGASCSFSDIEPLLESFGDNEDLVSLFMSENSKNSEIYRVELHSDQQTTAGRICFVGVAMTLRWLLRMKKKVASAGGSQLQKRQRIH